MNYKKYTPYIIAFISFFVSLFYNELNISHLKSEAPERLEPKYKWVRTADDVSYLRPAENYYLRGVWKDNNPGRQSYFLRTPGYGYFRYILMAIFGMEDSYIYFKYVQVLFFSISVLLIFFIGLQIGLPLWLALILEGIFGLSPFASGFLYYSITEAISPALMIAYLFFLLSGYRKSSVFYFLLAAIVMAYIGVTRPILLFFGSALPLGIFWSSVPLTFRKKLFFMLLTCFIALEPIGMWALRSEKIAEKYVGIYPIYYPENNSQFRPTHRAIWDFQKSYGTDGLAFHQRMVPLWNATKAGDTSDVQVDSMIVECPNFVKEDIGERKLKNSYHLYKESILYQLRHYPANVAMPDTWPAIEKQVVSEFQMYTIEINRKHWLWCHIAVPSKLFKELSFHSNLSLYIFQHTYRGRWWMELARGIFLALHLLCCLSFIFIIVIRGDRLFRVIGGAIIGCYFFYLCYIFRGLEERYTLPILPLLLLALGHLFNELVKIQRVEAK